MTDTLIIVESPAKARTISKFLGPGFTVESSIGHIRDLPSSAAEIPSRYKGAPWARVGVDVDKGFVPLYIVPASKKAQVKKLRSRLASAEALYLATDEDREGEAIAWHLVEVLKPRVPVRRMVFHEITRQAINRALEATRDIDSDLVEAQEARRILDRLVGYEVSPLLWKKIKPRLSAGRVQSVATRLIVERERERISFVGADFWGVEGLFKAEGARAFSAKLTEIEGRKVATGKDFDPGTGKAKAKVRVLDGSRAGELASRLGGKEAQVHELKSKSFTNRPYAPFMTSTLQQEAGRKLKFNARRTMRVAQSLYENGYITYMRTDSISLSSEAVSAARQQVRDLYGEAYLPEKPRLYRSKSKSAQEAHEAIRPAGGAFRMPASLRSELDSDQYRLYELIWKRTLASQMKDAKGERTTLKLRMQDEQEGSCIFSVSGKTIHFPGFLRAYVEGSDDPAAELADQEKELPALKSGQLLTASPVTPTEHSTQPPQRFTEASLVKELESRGIGRPSTYASIIQTIQDRGYVWHKGSALVPSLTAFAVIRLLEESLPDLVDYDFTARMEDELDHIAQGKIDSRAWLSAFFFGRGKEDKGPARLTSYGLKAMIEQFAETIDPRLVSRIEIGETEEGEMIVARVGRYGPYLQEGESGRRVGIPEDLPPDELTLEKAKELLSGAGREERQLGVDPESGKMVFVKNGRFGWYVQLGENGGSGAKPKMASVWPTMDPESLSLDTALMLLAFPRVLGKHPETGEKITAQDGRFGPYLKMGKETRSLPDHDSLLTMNLEGALKLFAQPKKRGRRSSAALRELGEDPRTGKDLVIKDGRFGPYVTDGEVNASVPKAKTVEDLSLVEASELIQRREEKLKSQGKNPRAPKKKKAPRKKK